MDNNFTYFNNFIAGMDIGYIKFKGANFTWANNKEGEGFIQEKLDRFFGSLEWLLHFDTAEVQHVLRQPLDHSMLVLDTHLHRRKTKARFFF